MHHVVQVDSRIAHAGSLDVTSEDPAPPKAMPLLDRHRKDPSITTWDGIDSASSLQHEAAGVPDEENDALSYVSRESSVNVLAPHSQVWHGTISRCTRLTEGTAGVGG